MKKIIIILISVFSAIAYAQNPAVTSALKAKYSSAQWRTECEGWYLLSYVENGTNFYGFADKEGNVIVANAVKYKVHPGYVEMEVMDMLKKAEHDQWLLDNKQYEREYQIYLANEKKYENQLAAYNKQKAAATDYAKNLYDSKWNEAYKYYYAKYDRDAKVEQQRIQRNSSGSTLGAIFGGISSAVTAINVPLQAKKAANDAVDYDLILAEVLAQRNLMTAPYKDYNPMPKKPKEPSTGLEWKSYPLLQPCPYTNLDLSKLDDVNSTAIVKKDGKYGLINARLKEVVPCVYDSFVKSDNDTYKVSKDGNYGLITATNRVIVPIQYDNFKISGNIYIMNKNGKYGVSTLSGTPVLPMKYSSIEEKDKYLFCMEQGKYGVFTTKGEEVLQAQYESIQPFAGIYYKCMKKGLWGVFTLGFSELYPCQFQDLSLTKIGTSSILLNKQNGSWGALDFNTGKELIANRYANIKDIKSGNDGYFEVLRDNNVGVFSLNGKMVLPCNYQSIKIEENTIIVKKNNLTGVCDKNGIELLSPEYDSYATCEKLPGIFVVKKGNLYGVCAMGAKKALIPCLYSSLEFDSTMNAFIASKNSDMWGVVDMEGRELFQFIYLPEGSSLHSSLGGKYLTYGFFNKKYKYTSVSFDGQILEKDKQSLPDLDKKTIKNKKYIMSLSSSQQKADDMLKSYNVAMSNLKAFYEKYNSFSFYAKNYVERIINDWQIKGEFEKIEDWSARVNENTRQQKVYELTHEAQEEYIRKNRVNMPVDNLSIVGNYDSEHETYQIKSNYQSNPITVHIPLEDAQEFKQKFESVRKTPVFGIKDDRLALVGYTFSLNSKYFKYSENDNLSHSVAKVDYTFNPLGDGFAKGLSTASLTYGTSDVDRNIPETGVVQENTFAIIIANELYTNEKTVEFAYNDGSIFKEYCIKALGIPASNVHFVPNATLNQMRQQFNFIKNAAEAYKGKAKFIVYYAGHGMPDDATKDAYLLPVDGFHTDLESAYKLSQLYKMLGEIPSENVLVFLDACFSGAQRSGETLASARGIAIRPRISAPTGNMIVYSAVANDETAFPYKDKVHGLFTYFLLKKMQESPSTLDLGSLHDYVSEHVSKFSISKNQKTQHPTITPAPKMLSTWRNIKMY